MSSSINVSIVLSRNKVHLGIRHNDYKYLSSGAAKRSFLLRLGVMQVLYDFAKRQRFTIAVMLNDILRDPTPKQQRAQSHVNGAIIFRRVARQVASRFIFDTLHRIIWGLVCANVYET